MTASEFAFMALGLMLGAASGVALIVVLRARPPARREVRVTVAPNSVARRRPSTLSEISETPDAGGPARGGPGDRRWMDRDLPAENDPNQPDTAAAGTTGDPATRTGVPSLSAPFHGAGPGAGSGSGAGPGAGSGSGAGNGAGARNGAVGIAISREPDPMLAALHASATSGPRVLMPSGIETGPDALAVRSSVATMGRAEGAAPRAMSAESAFELARVEASLPDGASSDAPTGAGQTGDGGGGDPAGVAAPATTGTGPCDEPKRIADERCLVATRAREGAAGALEAFRTAQRTYDEHHAQAEAQSATADPRAVRTAKEAAQQTFRFARSGGRTRDDVEAAARDWLTEINRINLETREASALAERHRIAANQLALDLERLSVEADAARISAEAADEACVAAREAVAACQEAAAVVAAGGRPAGTPAAPPRGRPGPASVAEDDEDGMASRAGEDAVIIRLLRGDREALGRLVARLGGDDPAERRRWQTMIGGLLEAFVARSIEASAFDFPTTHAFWGTFTRSQSRDIAAALSSLGYRHDGFGSWADEHMPSQRDLSLAVGYAGLDPMRIRHWPSEPEMQDLLREVTVAADEYIWEVAGTLTLGELVSVLGRRADAMAELWNEWGTVRPLLLAAD